MLWICLLAACLRTPPQVFLEGSVEPPAPPPELVVEARDNECDILDVYGDEDPVTLPACFGHVISTTKALELTHHEDVANYWAARAGVCERYREHDRSYCQIAYEAKWDEAEVLRREGALLRLGVVAAFIGGVAIGGGIAVGTIRALDLSVVP